MYIQQIATQLEGNSLINAHECVSLLFCGLAWIPTISVGKLNNFYALSGAFARWTRLRSRKLVKNKQHAWNTAKSDPLIYWCTAHPKKGNLSLQFAAPTTKLTIDFSLVASVVLTFPHMSWVFWISYETVWLFVRFIKWWSSLFALRAISALATFSIGFQIFPNLFFSRIEELEFTPAWNQIMILILKKNRFWCRLIFLI